MNKKIYTALTSHRKNVFVKFIRFLKEKGIYSVWKYNVGKNKSPISYINYSYGHNYIKFFNNCPEYELVNYSLVWGDTKQGHDFWHIINQEWMNFCDSNKIYD